MRADQRFLKPDSGRHWQISGEGQEDFCSRSLWDRKLKVSGRKTWTGPLYYSSGQFPDEPLDVIERGRLTSAGTVAATVRS